MADPNIPPPPPGFKLDSAPALGQRPVYQEGPPQPTPQTPEQKTNTLTNIKQGQTSIANQQQGMRLDRVKAATAIGESFRNDQTVKAYREVIPQVAQAMSAGQGGPADISVIYAWAKAMDPTGSVRDSDVQLGQSATGPMQQARFLISQYHLEEGGQLPPDVRVGLVEQMRNKAGQLDHQYSAVRDHYIQTARANGLDPSIIGAHEGEMYRPTEEAYITAHGGTPRDPNAPVSASTAPKVGEFGGEQDPRLTELNPAQKAAYDAWWKANPNPTPEQLQQFGSTISLNIPSANAADIVAAKKAGRGLSSDIQAIPDISKERGQGGIGETAEAAIRGFTDVPTFGLADKIAAVGDTLTDPGSTFRGNLAKQYAISDYDTQNHPWARGLGQLGGAFAVPMGEINSLGQLALKGGAVGAGYGVGSSRSLSDIPQNALMNGAVGATAPVGLTLIGRGGRAAINALRGGPKGIPPLVDPATGELNQPMDAMRPADRVQAMRDYGMQTITPGMAGGRTARVLEQGFNNVPGSAGVMEDVNAAASGELRRSMQGVAQKFGQSKTLNEGGAELQRGANEWMTRADKVTSIAYDAISIPPGNKASLTNTISTLGDLTSKVGSNKVLAEEVNDPILKRYLDAMQSGGLDWRGLKEFRTFIGQKAGEFRFSQDARKDGYQALYGALSQDMRDTAASIGPKQLREFERANSLFAAKENRIEQGLVQILGNDVKASPEKAAAAVQAMTRGGKGSGDLARLAQVRASTIKSGAWDEIASTMIHLGGQPANSEGRAFSSQTFVQWYADMAEPARRMLFKPELRKSLDGFVAMTQQLGRVKGLTNTSNTTPTMIGSGVIAAGGLAAISHPMALLGIVGGGIANYGMARLWTSSKFVNLVTGYGRAAMSGNPNAVKSQVGRLSKLAATDPELRAPIENLLKSIANDNAVPSIAASSNPNGDQNQQ